MTTIAIQLPDEQAEQLALLARRLNLTVEQLATAGVLDLLTKPDEKFGQAARHVLKKMLNFTGASHEPTSHTCGLILSAVKGF